MFIAESCPMRSARRIDRADDVHPVRDTVGGRLVQGKRALNARAGPRPNCHEGFFCNRMDLKDFVLSKEELWQMDEGAGKLARYDPKNLRFRKAYIRERLVDVKREREDLIFERDKIDAALKEDAAATVLPAPPSAYANENLRFRKAYIRERMEHLKHEREVLVAERDKIVAELAHVEAATQKF